MNVMAIKLTPQIALLALPFIALHIRPSSLKPISNFLLDSLLQIWRWQPMAGFPSQLLPASYAARLVWLGGTGGS